MRTLAPFALFALACIDSAPSVDDFEFTDMEIATHDGVNDYRESIGLPALELHGGVGAPARGHSEDMSAGKVPFSHDGFEQRADQILIDVPGVFAVGENVATVQGFPDPVAVAIQGWLDSPEHLANIEDVWTYSGVGIAGNEEDGWYFTQMFAD